MDLYNAFIKTVATRHPLGILDYDTPLDITVGNGFGTFCKEASTDTAERMDQRACSKMRHALVLPLVHIAEDRFVLSGEKSIKLFF